MDNQDQHTKSILPIIFFIAQVIFIIIVISILSLNVKSDKIGEMEVNRQPTLTIKDLNSQLSDGVYQGSIETVLTKTVELNTENFNVNDTVNIREGSLSTIKFENIDSVYFSAIIDIPNLQQSYQVYALYPLSNEAPAELSYSTQYVLCLDGYSEKIYPNFDCKDLFESDTRQYIVSVYLEYFDFDGFSAFTTQNSDYSIVYIDADPDLDLYDTTRQSYIQEVKKAIRSLGISPELFEYRVIQQSYINDLQPLATRPNLCYNTPNINSANMPTLGTESGRTVFALTKGVL